MAQPNTKNVVVGISSQLLSAKRSRKYILIQNKEPIGGNNVYIHWGDDVATTSNGVVLGPTEVHDVQVFNQGQLSAIADVAPVNVLLLEF